MAVKWVLRGTGITQTFRLERDECDLLDERADASSAGRNPESINCDAETKQFKNTFEDLTSHIADQCRDVIAENSGMPDEDSDYEFALRVMAFFHAAQDFINDGDASLAASLGFLMGEMSATHKMKKQFEAYALSGHRFWKSGKLGGRPRSKNDARDVLMAKEFTRRQKAGKNKSPSAIKEEVGRDLYRLGRTASINGIDRGLKKMSAKPV
jgi:hypothetical protein